VSATRHPPKRTAKRQKSAAAFAFRIARNRTGGASSDQHAEISRRLSQGIGLVALGRFLLEYTTGPMLYGCFSVLEHSNRLNQYP
jgi:hypothetical protein